MAFRKEEGGWEGINENGLYLEIAQGPVKTKRRDEVWFGMERRECERRVDSYGLQNGPRCCIGLFDSTLILTGIRVLGRLILELSLLNVLTGIRALGRWIFEMGFLNDHRFFGVDV